jgi:hypothetical protein
VHDGASKTGPAACISMRQLLSLAVAAWACKVFQIALYYIQHVLQERVSRKHEAPIRSFEVDCSMLAVLCCAMHMLEDPGDASGG